MVGQCNWQKSEANLPKVPMIIKDGSGGKYHKIYQKGNSSQWIHRSEMLGMSVINFTAECEYQNGKSAKLA